MVHYGHLIQIIGLVFIILNSKYKWMDIWASWVVFGFIPFSGSLFYSLYQLYNLL